MKKILLLFSLLIPFTIVYSQKNIISEGDIITAYPSNEQITGNQSETIFEVDIPVAGMYYINSWLMPLSYADGSFTTYSVTINNNKFELQPEKEGFQNFLLSNKIFLTSGKNIIIVGVELPETANIEFLKISKNFNSTQIGEENYQSFISEANHENSESGSYSSDGIFTDLIETNSLVPGGGASITIYNNMSSFGNYKYARVNLKYSYFARYHFSAGERVTISTSEVIPSSNIYHGHDLYFFQDNLANIDNRSWSYRSSTSGGNNIANLTVTIPVTGYYCVAVFTKHNTYTSTCNVTVNNRYANNVPISRNEYICQMDNQSYYNTFTKSTNGDPRLFIKEGTSQGRIVGYNDNYDGVGDFNWSKNSRIKKQFKNNTTGILVSASSTYPTGTAMLYAGLKNSNVITFFENLNIDDAIMSAPQTGDYNCISWSGGIEDYWEWPMDEFSDYYVPSSGLACFDKFYSSKRYPGSRIYTRDGATEENAEVGLYGWEINPFSEPIFTHAARTNNGPEPNGYDWESKPGGLMRTFHPKNSLNGNQYGEIYFYYRFIGYSSQDWGTLSQAIAEDEAVIETVGFSPVIKQVFQTENARMSTIQRNEFNSKYNIWKATWENSPHSNPEKFKNKAYTDLLNYCKSTSGANYLLFEKVESDVLALLLVKELTLHIPKNQAILENIKGENQIMKISHPAIVTTPKGNGIKYINQLLGGSSYKINAKNEEDDGQVIIRYSNEDDFDIFSNHNGITISFNLQEEANISISIYDLNGRFLTQVLNKQNLPAGYNEYYVPMNEKGIFLVKYIMNGNVNVKKITVG